MPYPVDHDTRNRLSAVPMMVSPLQTRGLELAFSRLGGVRPRGPVNRANKTTTDRDAGYERGC